MKRMLLTLIALLTMPLVHSGPDTASHAGLLGPAYVNLLEGEGSHPGGWPTGMANASVRFIRMKYDGAGWDDGMDAASRADLNFLDYFHKLTEFKTAPQPEAHGIALLAKYPKGYAPPFVYMTGTERIGASERDIKAMREYLMAGGMLFADCGSLAWHTTFQEFIKRVFPGENLTAIPRDDVIFRVPFELKDGAPPAHRYGGSDAMGIKHKGRWAVFYHPGKLTDAWKTNRGGLTSKDAEGALEMGVNLVYYAFSVYLELTRKYRGDISGSRSLHRVQKRPLWERCSLASIGAYDEIIPGDGTLQLIRKCVKQDSDLLDAMNRLEEVPFKVSAVRESQAQGLIGKTRALVFDIAEGRTLVLIFDVEARTGRAPSRCTLRDSFLLTVHDTKVSVLLDVIPKEDPPKPDDFSRVLTWCESSFMLLDKVQLKEMLTQESVESARAPITPVVTRHVDLPRPEEIPRSIDDVPHTGDWGQTLSTQAESQLNSISLLPAPTNRQEKR